MVIWRHRNKGLKNLLLFLGLTFSLTASAHGGFHGGGGGWHGGWGPSAPLIIHGGNWGGYGGYGGYYPYPSDYYDGYYYPSTNNYYGPDCNIVQHCYPNGDCLQEPTCSD